LSKDSETSAAYTKAVSSAYADEEQAGRLRSQKAKLLPLLLGYDARQGLRQAAAQWLGASNPTYGAIPAFYPVALSRSISCSRRVRIAHLTLK
jgi:hypothetical protein